MPTFKVPKEAQGQKLIDFLHEKQGGSKRAIKRSLDSGHCILNKKKEHFAKAKLKVGDLIEYTLPRARRKSVKTLYEDEFFLAIDKPPGLTCEVKEIEKYLNRSLPGELLHRLDKETTGVLLIPKTEEILASMRKLFSERKMEKVYLAIVDGTPKESKGIIDNWIYKEEGKKGEEFSNRGSRGERAITSWRCLRASKGHSLIECRPITGRTHQIRIHLSGLGHPVLGDTLYGGRAGAGAKAVRYLLHAKSYAFQHPITRKGLKIEVEPPDDFLRF